MHFDIFMRKMANGQLKNTSAVDEDVRGVIVANQMQTILDLTNDGLRDLSSRLKLFEYTVDLNLIAGQTTYDILTSQVGGYLSDTGHQPFANEIVKVLAAESAGGTQLIRDTGGVITTPTFNSIKVSSSTLEDLMPSIEITYQAQHPEITMETGSPEIMLPPGLITCLQLFVASLYLSHMNGPEHSAKGDSYFAAYSRHLQSDINSDAASISEVIEDNHFSNGGWR